jgi:hypothetical protein
MITGPCGWRRAPRRPHGQTGLEAWHAARERGACLCGAFRPVQGGGSGIVLSSVRSRSSSSMDTGSLTTSSSFSNQGQGLVAAPVSCNPGLAGGAASLLKAERVFPSATQNTPCSTDKAPARRLLRGRGVALGALVPRDGFHEFGGNDVVSCGLSLLDQPAV